MGLLVVIVAIFFVVAFALVIFGILYRPQLKYVKLPGNQGTFNKQCGNEKVSCNLDADCQEMCVGAQQGEDFVCKALPGTPGLTPTQQKKTNFQQGNNSSGNPLPQKYCVPAKAKMDCNIATGGIPVFAGWSGSTRMEFDCLCSYPLWANSRQCDPNTGECTGNCLLNPNVCAGGTFNWDLTKVTEEPAAGLCECPPGKTMVVSYDGSIPICVPDANAAFYNDLDLNTGKRGTQPIIQAQSINPTKLTGGSCQHDFWTKCEAGPGVSGCCMMPDAVCCGVIGATGYCCPTGYSCDLQNKRCVQLNTDCTSDETKCSHGCCPIANATCCANGSTCCPPTFPKCDPENGTCNPELIPMTPGACESVNDTDCAGNCCPQLNGSCCPDGKHCCPSEYPVCDLENNMCRPAPS
jgi:hypothetical protein